MLLVILASLIASISAQDPFDPSSPLFPPCSQSECGPIPQCFAPLVCIDGSPQAPQCVRSSLSGMCQWDFPCGSCACPGPDGVTVGSNTPCPPTGVIDPCVGIACTAQVLDCGDAPVIQKNCCPACAQPCSESQCGPAPLCPSFSCPAGSSPLPQGCFETEQGFCAHMNPCGGCVCENGKQINSPDQTCDVDVPPPIDDLERCLQQCGPPPACAFPPELPGLVQCPADSVPVGAECRDGNGDGICEWINPCGGCLCESGEVVSIFDSSCAVAPCQNVACTEEACANGLSKLPPAPGACCGTCPEECTPDKCPQVMCPAIAYPSCSQRGGVPLPSGCRSDEFGQCVLSNPCNSECQCNDGRIVNGFESCDDLPPIDPNECSFGSCGPMPVCFAHFPCPPSSIPLDPVCVPSSEVTVTDPFLPGLDPAHPQCQFKHACGGCRCLENGFEFDSSTFPFGSPEWESACDPSVPLESACEAGRCGDAPDFCFQDPALGLFQSHCPPGTSLSQPTCIDDSPFSCHWSGCECVCENGQIFDNVNGCGEPDSGCAAVACPTFDELNCGFGIEPILKSDECCARCPDSCSDVRCGNAPVCPPFWSNCDESQGQVAIEPQCLESVSGGCAWHGSCSGCRCQNQEDRVIFFGESCDGGVDPPRPDCSLIDCAIPECGEGEVAVLPPDSCCETCEPVIVQGCACAAIDEEQCENGVEDYQPAGCPEEAVCVRCIGSGPDPEPTLPSVDPPHPSHCQDVACTLAIQVCEGGVQPWTRSGECCPSCPTPEEINLGCVADDGTDKANTCADSSLTCTGGKKRVRGEDCCFTCGESQDDDDDDNAATGLGIHLIPLLLIALFVHQ